MRRLALALLLLLPAACTAPGTAEEAGGTVAAAADDDDSGALVRPFPRDERSQRERDLATIGREECPGR